MSFYAFSNVVLCMNIFYTFKILSYLCNVKREGLKTEGIKRNNC